MDYVRNCMHAIQRLDKGAMCSYPVSQHHAPAKRDELFGLQKANRVHSIIQGTALGVAAVVVIIVLVVLFLVKRRRRNSAVRQVSDSEANCVVELQINNVSRNLTVAPLRPNSPYLGDRYPDGLIGGGQSPRVRVQPDDRNRQ